MKMSLVALYNNHLHDSFLPFDWFKYKNDTYLLFCDKRKTNMTKFDYKNVLMTDLKENL